MIVAPSPPMPHSKAIKLMPPRHAPLKHHHYQGPGRARGCHSNFGRRLAIAAVAPSPLAIAVKDDILAACNTSRKKEQNGCL